MIEETRFWTQPINHGITAMTKRCPNEETLHDYLDGRLPSGMRETIEDHLSRCDVCRELIAVFDSVNQLGETPDMVSVPGPVTGKALATVRQMERKTLAGKINTGIHQVKNGMRQWSRKLEWFWGQETVLVRGDQAATADVVQVTKVLAGMDALIEIEKCGDAKACIRVDLFSTENIPPSVRVTLVSGDREVASCLCTGSPALFEDIPFGSYALIFTRQGKPIGDYAFELRES